MKTVIKADSIIRDYSETIQVLKGIDFSANEGEFIGIMGRSGCGKTTLLKILGLIDRPTQGTVYFQGRDTGELDKDELSDIRRKELGFIFQDFCLMDNLTVRENIYLPSILDRDDISAIKERTKSYAARTGLSHLLDKTPSELSGGEKQRTAICRALMNSPTVILADEPTGSLDSQSGEAVMNMLEEINRNYGKTIILVTHDARVAAYCDKIITMRDGSISDILQRGQGEDRDSFCKRITLGLQESIR